jgi:hypothetical protein
MRLFCGDQGFTPLACARGFNGSMFTVNRLPHKLAKSLRRNGCKSWRIRELVCFAGCKARLQWYADPAKTG